MRRFFVLFFVMLLPVLAIASDSPDDESLEGLLSRENYYKCDDFQYNATLLIPKLYEAGKIDSVYLIIDYIEEVCDKRFRWTSTRMLLDMEQGKFTEDVYDSTILSDMYSFRYLVESLRETDDASTWNYSRQANEADSKYRKFFNDLATRMYEKYQGGTLEHLWAGFFMGDFHYFYRELKQPRYSSSDIQRYYLEMMYSITEQHRGQGTNYAGYGGLWIPHGSNELFGNKPELGFLYGYKMDALQFDLACSFRFTKSKAEYTYYDDDLEITTDKFHNIYFGGELGYELFTRGESQFELLGGVGYEGISGVGTDSNNGDGHYMNSLNLNLGFRYKYFLSKYHDWYIGVQTRYNWVDFDSEGGSDLSGNAASLQLVVGRLNSGLYKHLAKRYGFFD